MVGAFAGDELEPALLERLCAEAYASFRHPAVCPLVQLDADEWLLELFHGPTLAFKDLALQLVGRLFDHVLSERDERITVLVATSGDTGSAAISGLASCSRAEIVVLYPEGRVSDVQRRQMTTVDAANVHAVAVEGTFDDCQRIVKELFADAALRERAGLAADELDQLGARRRAGRLLRVGDRLARRSQPRRSRCRRATSATCSPAGSRAPAACRSSGS